MADQSEAFEKLLSANLTRAVEFVKFAEAKNAALLTFTSAWAALCITLLTSDRELTPGILLAFRIALPIFVVAALIAIWSFLPKRKIEILHRDPNQAKNLLYFGHIASFDVAAYSQRVKERYAPPDGTPVSQNYIDDLIVQIAVNSQIADRKFTKFNFGVALLFVAMVVLGAPMAWAGVRWVMTSGVPDADAG